MNESKEEKFDDYELICGQCPIDQLQKIIYPRQTPKIFSPVYYIKWFYQCPQCGKQTKLYCSKK